MYINYGDVNFFEYGCLVDSEHNENVFSFLYCRPFDDVENLFYFGSFDVDITDLWIDKKGVMSYIGMSEKDFDPIYYAIGCVDYYGIENFTGGYNTQYTKEEIFNILKYQMIASDNLHIEW